MPSKGLTTGGQALDPTKRIEFVGEVPDPETWRYHYWMAHIVDEEAAARGRKEFGIISPVPPYVMHVMLVKHWVTHEIPLGRSNMVFTHTIVGWADPREIT